MNTERYDAYRKAAQQSPDENAAVVIAQLAVAEATLLVAEQLERQADMQREWIDYQKEFGL